MPPPTYNTRNVRRLLTEAFTDEKLREICGDIPEFRPVLEEFSMGMSKAAMIDRLIGYCQRYVLMPQLLSVIQEENPQQYALFADTLIVDKTQLKPTPPPDVMPDETEHLKKLLRQKTRELYDLQIKAAQFGTLNTPSYITLQIEDLEKEIAELQQRLDT